MSADSQQLERQEFSESLRHQIRLLRHNVLQQNCIDVNELKSAENEFIIRRSQQNGRFTADYLRLIAILAVCIALIGVYMHGLWDRMLGVRCIVPNNYLVWEATRLESDCKYCRNVSRPIILNNITRDEFFQYAYSAGPIIIKNAANDWPARTQLTYKYLKELYYKYPNSLEHFEDDCQFLPFKSSFNSLNEFFQMSDQQVSVGKPTWYVGFSNCQANILAELRQLYPRPHFLPEDAEIPNTDYIFMGYDEGAVMHLDYIPRLMWQAQLQGNKTWHVSPTPECDCDCSSFQFYVEPGDAVLIDTRIWYHGTSVAADEFSMTIQSEYG